VQTMTVNTEAARRMQEDFIRRKQAARRGNQPRRAPTIMNGVLVTMLLVTLAAIAMVIYQRHPGLLGM